MIFVLFPLQKGLYLLAIYLEAVRQPVCLHKLQAVNNISLTLKRGGYFIVSMTEILTGLHTKHFISEKVNGIYFCRKR